jgi:phage shock protein E
MRLINLGLFSLSILLISCGEATSETEEKEKKETVTVQQEPVAKDISVAEFSKMNKEHPGIIFDVRTPEEWEQGVVEGAVKMNFFDEDFKDQALTLDKDKPVYVYCKAGGRSAKTMKLLSENGFTEVYNVLGGMTAIGAEKPEMVK